MRPTHERSPALRTGPMRPPPIRHAVFGLALRTWADGEQDGHYRSGQAIIRQALGDPRLDSVLVSDPLRSWASRVSPRAGKVPSIGADPSRRLLQNYRLRRGFPGNPTEAEAVFARVERRLLRRLGPHPAVLVTSDPVQAALAHPEAWADVVFHAWDDFAEAPHPHHRAARELYLWAYDQMVERDVKVISVAERTAERIGTRRHHVVPNGVTAAEFERPGHPPEWFARLRTRVALYAGTMESRVDTAALAELAEALGPSWTVVMVGLVTEPEPFERLRTLPNVVIADSWHPRPQVLAMMGHADVCLMPHLDTALTRTMSPLKMYEYLAAGTPVVATDLPTIRSVSGRCRLIPPGAPWAPAVQQAGDGRRASAAEIDAFRAAHDWQARYREWRSYAFAGRG